MLLVENTLDGIETLTEAAGDGKKTYLRGIFMEAAVKNRNGRVYKQDEMLREVERVQMAADTGHHILGELDHPDSSSEVKLKNVSHKIVELRMEGNRAIGKAEILERTTAGGILKGLVDSGVRVGVSSRARGSLGNDGEVSNFALLTIDAVAMPSARTAYPESIMESLEMYRRGEIVTDLAESIIHDRAAQKYFSKEMKKFIDSLKLL